MSCFRRGVCFLDVFLVWNSKKPKDYTHRMLARLLYLQSTMPRKPRILPESGMLHLIARSNNRVPLLKDRYDFFRMKDLLLKICPPALISIHHYSLMNTHIHLLAWVENTEILHPVIKSLTVSYHHYYTKKYKYRGHLWHGRFKSVLIENEFHWLQCGRYIEINAPHAGICKDPRDYPWSSYHYYADGVFDPLISQVKIPDGIERWKLGRKNTCYREFILAGIDLDYQKLKKQYERCAC